MATENAKTSRPQPFSTVIGAMKKPNDERGPQLMIAITQPHATMTAGVRHAPVTAGFGMALGVLPYIEGSVDCAALGGGILHWSSMLIRPPPAQAVPRAFRQSAD